MKIGVSFIIFLIALAPVAFAAGSSTVSPDELTVEDYYNSPDESYSDGSCDDITDNRKDRIKCKLKQAREDNAASIDAAKKRVRNSRYNYEKRDYVNEVIPEACKRLGDATDTEITSKEQCREFYNKVQDCYSKSGNEKTKCFRKNAGFDRKSIRDASPNQVRHYIVAILYDIQERIEHSNENDKISDDDAAEIIDLIVELKEDLMNGEARDVVKPKMMELRSMIKEAKQLNNDSDEGSEESVDEDSASDSDSSDGDSSSDSEGVVE